MSKLSSVKMESIEFAKRHFNGSSNDFLDCEEDDDDDDIDRVDEYCDEVDNLANSGHNKATLNGIMGQNLNSN